MTTRKLLEETASQLQELAQTTRGLLRVHELQPDLPIHQALGILAARLEAVANSLKFTPAETQLPFPKKKG